MIFDSELGHIFIRKELVAPNKGSADYETDNGSLAQFGLSFDIS